MGEVKQANFLQDYLINGVKKYDEQKQRYHQFSMKI